jgi:hypothetical protein
MRKVTITDLNGESLGTITEGDDGALTGDGKGESLLEQAPGKTYDEWIDHGHHSKYLRYVEEAETASTA